MAGDFSRIRIDKMRKRHVSAVKEIEKECHLSRWSKSDYLAETKRESSICLVASDEKSESIFGFAVMRLITIDDCVDGNSMAVEGELLNIGVRNSFKRNGIGRKLLYSLIISLNKRKACRVLLEVRESNSVAIGFYRSMEFIKIGLRKNLYRKPTENGVVMELNLR